jgi:hypothetical protein
MAGIISYGAYIPRYRMNRKTIFNAVGFMGTFPLEDELKVLKNELREVLMDLREQYLNMQDPFNSATTFNSDSAPRVITAEKRDKQERPEVGWSENNPGLGVAADRMSGTNLAGQIKEEEADRPNLGAEMRGAQNAELTTADLHQRSAANTGVQSERKSETRPDDKSEEEQPPKSSASRSRRKIGRNFNEDNDKADIVVIAGLTHWIDQATAKLGKERTEALVEMSSAIGRLPSDLKDALIRLARLSHHESNGESPAAGDYLAILAQLDNLVDGSKLQENALLSILSMMKDTRSG